MKSAHQPQREPAFVPDGHLRVSIVTHLPQVLRELGHDPAEVLSAFGIDPSFLDDRENVIEFRTVGRLIEYCAERTGCGHVGLLIGEASKLSDLGRVGLLAQHSPDVGTALRSLIKHLHLHDRGGVPTLERAGELAMLGYAVYEGNTPGSGQIHAAATVTAQKVMQALCGPGWRASQVLLALRRPADVEPFRRAFGAPILFNAGRCALIFPSRLLRQPTAAADAVVCRSLEAVVAAMEARSGGQIVSETRRALRAMLSAGHVTEEAVARAFALHRRTLNRRLRVEGVNFRRLLDEMRFEVSRQMLRDSDAAVEEIAYSLGYGAASAFARAFRRWSGMAPHVWRAHVKQSPSGESVGQE
jgi:AraC-like DNA-binding protein